MIRSTSMRFALLALAAGLLAVLPASAVAAKPEAKTKTTIVNQTFPLSTNSTDGQADDAAVCPSNTTLLSGGALANTPAPVPVPNLATEIYISGPIGNAWYVRYEEDAGVNLAPSAQAICIKDRLKTTGIDGGPKAISKVTQVNTAFTLPDAVAPTNGHVEVDVACPSGTQIAGGGARFIESGDNDVQLQESGPQGNGWHIRYDNDEGTGFSQPAIASALCLKSKLKIEDENDKAKSKFEQVDLAVTLPADASNNGRARFNVDCPKGTTIAGGGGKVTPSVALADADFELEESGAVGNGWQVTFDNGEATAQSASVHALCLKDKLKVS